MEADARAVVVGIGRLDAVGSDGCGGYGGGAPAWAEAAAALTRLGYRTTEVHTGVRGAESGSGVADTIAAARVVYVTDHGRIGPGVAVGPWIADAERSDAPTLFLLDLWWADAAALRALVDRSETSARVWVIAAGVGEPGVCDGGFGRVLGRVFDEVARTGLDADPARPHVAFSVAARRIRQAMGELPGRGLPVYSTATPSACATVAGRPVVVTGGQGDRIRIRRLDIPDPIDATLAEPVWWVHAIACTTVRGRPIAATGSRDNAVRLWDLTGRARLGEPLTGHTGWVTALACTTLHGRPIVVSGSADATIRMWDPLTGRPIGTSPTGHTGPVHAPACTVLDGRPVVVSGSADGTVRVWDPAEGRPVGAPMTGHTGVVHALACTTVRGRPVVVGAAGDATARVWDPRAGTPLGRPLTGHADSVHAVACGTVGGRSVAATGADDHTARIWDLDAGRLLDRVLLPAPSRALTFTREVC